MPGEPDVLAERPPSEVGAYDVVFVGGGFRTTTFLASTPELVASNLLIVERSNILGPGSYADYAITSSSIGSRFFKHVDARGPFGTVLSDDDVERVATAATPVPLCDLATALGRLGESVLRAVGRNNVLLGTEVTEVAVRSDAGRRFVVFLADGRVVESAACVLSTGRREVVPRPLVFLGDRLWRSSEVLSVRRRAELRERLRAAGGRRVVVLGGSHSALAALQILLDTVEELQQEGGRIEPRFILAYRNPIRLYYETVEQARANQLAERELVFDPDLHVCSETGIVFRDSGLRHRARDLYLTVWRGEIPNAALERFASLDEYAPSLGDAALVVQALGYRASIPKLTVDRAPFPMPPSGRLEIDEDGRVVVPSELGELPLYALRVEPTPPDRRDNSNYGANLYPRLGRALRKDLARLRLVGRARLTDPGERLASYSRNTAPTLPALESGRGCRIFFEDGRQALDCCSQTLNLNLGHCHPDVVAAVGAQASKLMYASSRFSSDVALELHEKVVQITPEPLTKVNLACVTGSAANECAFKAARKATGKSEVVSLDGSHHGETFETMRASGKHWETAYLGERNAHFIPPPNCFRCPFGQTPDLCSVECLDDLESLLSSERDDICAVIAEPVMVDAGVLAPPPRYHRRMRELCSEHEVALIWDEIQTGFGWLGEMFAMDYYETVPDLVSLGKGLAAGFPLAAAMFGPEYDILEYGEHELTSGAHPVSCAAALAAIRYLETPRRLEEIARKGAYVRERFEELAERHPALGDVRGVGLLLGLEIVDPRDGSPDEPAASRIFKGLVAGGVVMRLGRVGASSNVLQFKPPVVITDDELDFAATMLGRVLAAA